MAKKRNLIRKKIIEFYNIIKDKYSVKKVILYGSYAKGKETPNSDIDVGVVIDFKKHSKRVALTAKLFHYAAKIDNRIEPKCIFWDEYNNYDKASILAEIIRTGVDVLL